MKRIVAFIVAAIAFAGPARADYVTSNTPLPANKITVNPLPPGANPAQYFLASDYNNLATATNNLRTAVTTGAYLGLGAQTTDPTARSVYPSANYFWYKTDGTLHFYNGTDNTLLFSGGGAVAGLKGAYNGGATTADNVVLLTNTLGQVVLQDNASTLGNLFIVQNNGATVNYLQISSNTTQFFKTGASTSTTGYVFDTVNSLTADLFQIKLVGTTKARVDVSGNLSLAAGLFLGANQAVTGSASATNTTGLSLVSQVADGASSIGLNINNTTTLSSGGSLLLQVQNNGSTKFQMDKAGSLLLNSNPLIQGGASVTNSTGLILKTQVTDGASTIGTVFDNSVAITSGKMFSWRSANTEYFAMTYDGTVLKFQGKTTNTLFWGNAGAGIADQGGIAYLYSNGLATVQVLSSNYIAAATDNGASSGASGINWSSNWAYRYITGAQPKTDTASISINPANGDYVTIPLGATAITAVTVSAGNNGEEMVAEVFQDATGSRTIATTWTGVAFAGGSYTASSTANFHDVITFVYNSTLAKWVETGRALAVR